MGVLGIPIFGGFVVVAFLICSIGASIVALKGAAKVVSAIAK